MFGALFKKKNSENLGTEQVAKGLYACALESTRKNVFYEEYEVPDSFDGRFDLLLLHVFLILNRMMGQENYDQLSQALFDVMFRDMDQTLREMGIGDMGVPKHMKRMMKAFNGRMYNYQMAVAPDTLVGVSVEGLEKTTLHDALIRNLYGQKVDGNAVSKEALEKMSHFVEKNLNCKTPSDIEALQSGYAEFVSA